MRSQVHNYSFDPTTKVVTLTDFDSVELGRLLVITSTTQAECMFTFADDAPGLASVSPIFPNAFVLTHDTTGMTASEALTIFYDLGPGDPGYKRASTLSVLGITPDLFDGVETLEVQSQPPSVFLVGPTGEPLQTENGGLRVSVTPTLKLDQKDNLLVTGPGYTATGEKRGGGESEAGAVVFYSEVDSGSVTGRRDVLSPEVDLDYRLRVAQDNIVDQESFNYSTQNTNKYQFASVSPLVMSQSAAGLLTNSGSATTASVGATFGTWAVFPVGGTQTVVCETVLSFSTTPTAVVSVDFGLFQRSVTAATYAPGLDGVYFRMSDRGIEGITNSNGVETTTGVFPSALGGGVFRYVPGQVYRFLIQCNNVSTTFWINNVKYGELFNSAGFPCKSVALPWSISHLNGPSGAAGVLVQATVTDYRISVRGEGYDAPLNTINQRVLGSYETLSGNTPGALMAGTITAGTLVKPTAAVPLNASLAANLPNSLGGRIRETLTAGLAVDVDAIFAQFQVPAASAAVQGRRLVIMGLKLSSSVTTAITGGACTTEWFIGFGATASSLATPEVGAFAAPTSKGPRRIACPSLTQRLTAAQAVETAVSQPGGTYESFADAPIYVNPGEFLTLIGNKTATALPTAGVISHFYQFVYSWE